MTPRPDLRSFLRASLLTALLAATAAPGFASSERHHQTEQWFEGTYVASLAGGDPNTCFDVGRSQFCAVGGALVCDNGQGAGLGGSCTRVTIPQGGLVTVDAFDSSGIPTSFAACIDSNRNTVCRPEEVEDTLVFRHCAGAPLEFTNAKASGELVIFMMTETSLSVPDLSTGSASAAACVPSVGAVLGRLRIDVPECSDLQDNDGDGATDWPFDPDCDDAFDTSERPPPPPPPPAYTH